MPRMLIVFDLDGTLVDSLSDIAGAMNMLLRSHGLPARDLDEYRRIVGDGARVAVVRATAERLGTDERVIDELTREYLDIYRARGSVDARPYPGVEDLVRRLGAVGAALGVLTNKPHDMGCDLVSQAFPGVAFAAVEGVREGGPRKPDPAGLLEIMRRCAVERDRTVYVGDTDTDMRTGRAARVFTVGCLWGFRDEEELRAAGADAIISSPDELPALLRGLESDRAGQNGVTPAD